MEDPVRDGVRESGQGQITQDFADHVRCSDLIKSDIEAIEGF